LTPPCAPAGTARPDLADLAAARRAWTQALRIFDEIDHPDRDLVRAKLLSSSRTPTAAG